MCRTRIATGGTSSDTGQGSSGMAEQSTSARPCHPRGTPGSSSSKERGKHPTLDEVTVEQCCALPSGSTSLQSLCMRPASPLQGHCPLSPPRSLRCVVWRLHPPLTIPPTFRSTPHHVCFPLKPTLDPFSPFHILSFDHPDHSHFPSSSLFIFLVFTPREDPSFLSRVGETI